MNRFLNNSLALTLAATSLVAASTAPVLAAGHTGHGLFANDNRGPDPYTEAQQTSPAASSMLIRVSSDQAIDQSIRHWKHGRFVVQNVGDLAAGQAAPINDRATEPAYLNRLHKAIEGNKMLSEKLLARNIEVKNVIGAEQAADGSLTLYTR